MLCVDGLCVLCCYVVSPCRVLSARPWKKRWNGDLFLVIVLDRIVVFSTAVIWSRSSR